MCANSIHNHDMEAAALIDVSIEEACVKLNAGAAILLDVRNQDEVSDNGKAEFSVVRPLSIINKFIGLHDDDGMDPQISVEDRLHCIRTLTHAAFLHMHIYCICNTGTRSRAAAALFRKMGYVHAYSVEGGMLAWAAAGKRVIGQQING